jgi:predicted DNA-binding transcriptional regulator YafY
MAEKTRKKAGRLNEVLALLKIKPRTVKDLCDQLDLPYEHAGRRAVLRDLSDLRREGYRIEPNHEKRPKYKLLSSPPSRLNVTEALAAHVALRLMYHHTPQAPRSYLKALDKIEQFMSPEMRTISGHSILTELREDRIFEPFDKIANAWHEREVITFEYLSMNSKSGEWRRVELETYFVEVSRSNFEIYVIGKRCNFEPCIVRTFLMREMRGVTSLKRHYTIPEDFDPKKFLSNAWGVIGDYNPVTVRLKFDASVRRWLEKRKLPGVVHQETTAEGDLILMIQTGTNNDGKPQELMPFIRGWGANVEVLEPQQVREDWLREARAVIEKFGGA